MNAVVLRCRWGRRSRRKHLETAWAPCVPLPQVFNVQGSVPKKVPSAQTATPQTCHWPKTQRTLAKGVEDAPEGAGEDALTDALKKA